MTNTNEQRCRLVEILNVTEITENEDVVRHLKLAAQKQLDHILGKVRPTRTSRTESKYFYCASVGCNMAVPTSEELNTGANDSKLSAIRDYKFRTNGTLMDSKAAMEEYFDKTGRKFA